MKTVVKIDEMQDRWVVNERYEIYKDCGVIYDTVKAKDIPYWVFQIKDDLMKIKERTE